MDSAVCVADATEVIYIRNLEDRSGFDNARLQPESWSLFKVVRGHGLRRQYRPDRMERYHSFSEAKAGYLRSRGIPALAYIDDAWYGN